MLFEIKEYMDVLATPIYLANGRKPWSPGYYTAKRRTICSAIDEGLFSGGSELPSSFGRHIDERVVECPWVFAQLAETPGRVLDAGSALNHLFLLDRPPLKDDVAISASTIEHIGLDNTMLYTGDVSKKESDALGFLPAITEFRRLLKPGGICLITVPFGRRGVHGWYQVFDQELAMKVVEAFRPSDYSIDYFGYFPDGWRRASSCEIADAAFFDVHDARDFAPDFAAGARGVACMKLIA